MLRYEKNVYLNLKGFKGRMWENLRIWEFEKCLRVSNSLTFYPNFQYQIHIIKIYESLISILENFSSSHLYKCQDSFTFYSIVICNCCDMVVCEYYALTWMCSNILCQKIIQLSWLMSVNNMKLNFHWKIYQFMTHNLITCY